MGLSDRQEGEPPVIIQFQVDVAGTMWALLDDGTLWQREQHRGAEWRWVPGPQQQWLEREVALTQREDHPVIYDQGGGDC